MTASLAGSSYQIDLAMNIQSDELVNPSRIHINQSVELNSFRYSNPQNIEHIGMYTMNIMVTVQVPIDSSLKCLSYLSYSLITALLRGIIARHIEGIIISHMLLLESSYSMLVPVIMMRTPPKEMNNTTKSIFESATLKSRNDNRAITKGPRFMTSETKTKGKALILVYKHIKPKAACIVLENNLPQSFLGILWYMQCVNFLFMRIKNIKKAKDDLNTMSCEIFIAGCLMNSYFPKN